MDLKGLAGKKNTGVKRQVIVTLDSGMDAGS